MTLSLGVEAQVETPGSVKSSQTGITIVDQVTAADRLAQHIDDLEKLNPTTLQEEVDQGAKLEYADYIINGFATGGDFAYHVLNSMTYLEGRLGDYASQYRPSSQDLYDEMVRLLQ